MTGGLPLGRPEIGRPRIVAIVVTYNSSRHIRDLLADLTQQTGDFELSILAVDNASADDTAMILADSDEVTLIPAGANLGYAGGLNVAWDKAGGADAILVVNPDLRLAPNAVHELWSRLQQPRVGVSVPRMLNADGSLYHSLKFEPTPARDLGDAVCGRRLPNRPRWLTGSDWLPSSYEHPHPVDWATGACLMVRGDVAQEVGRWDESYFLYSEEVDYLRRVRDAGWEVWYDPASEVHHEGGGSGTAPVLTALEAVNKVRYVERRNGAAGSPATARAIAVLGAALRAHRPGQREALRYLLRRDRWASLPGVAPGLHAGDADLTLHGSVVIPAHNEAGVLHRSVEPLATAARFGPLDVIVVANGCTDDTVERLSGIEGITAVDLSQASKSAALNAGDDIATTWPRLYLDADVEISPRTVADVFAALATGDVLAARPRFVYDTTGASWPVRGYYRARGRLPEASSRHLWGAGAYALTEAGHRRLGSFPDVVGDDLLVDSLFGDDEKRIVATEPVRVHTPRDLRSLFAVLRRTYRGNAEHAAGDHSAPPTTARTAVQLVRSATTPARFLDALVYAAIVIRARRRPAAGATPRWERDLSGRGEVAS